MVPRMKRVWELFSGVILPPHEPFVVALRPEPDPVRVRPGAQSILFGLDSLRLKRLTEKEIVSSAYPDGDAVLALPKLQKRPVPAYELY